MHWLTMAVGGGLDLWLAPLANASPLVGLASIAIVTTIVTLLLFRFSSSQERLPRVKRLIQASLFEMRLYKDEPATFLHVLGDSTRLQATYLRLSLVPMLWILPLFVILFVQLDARYGVHALRPGQETIIEIVLREDVASKAARPAVTLDAPDGVEVLGEPVWIPARRELTWRILAVRAGRFDVGVRCGDERVTKHMVTGNATGVGKTSSRLRGRGVSATLLSAEPPLPSDSVFESISIAYDEARMRVLGRRVHWAVVFLALSFPLALLLRHPLGVVI